MRRFLLPALMCLLLPMTAVHADSARPILLEEMVLTDVGTMVLCSKKQCHEFLPAAVTFDVASRAPYFTDGDAALHGMVALAPPATSFDDLLTLVDEEVAAGASNFVFIHDDEANFVCVSAIHMPRQTMRELCTYVAPTIDI